MRDYLALTGYTVSGVATPPPAFSLSGMGATYRRLGMQCKLLDMVLVVPARLAVYRFEHARSLCGGGDSAIPPVN